MLVKEQRLDEQRGILFAPYKTLYLFLEKPKKEKDEKSWFTLDELDVFLNVQKGEEF